MDDHTLPEVLPFDFTSNLEDAHTYWICKATHAQQWALEDATSLLEGVMIVRKVIPQVTLSVAKDLIKRIMKAA